METKNVIQLSPKMYVLSLLSVGVIASAATLGFQASIPDLLAGDNNRATSDVVSGKEISKCFAEAKKFLLSPFKESGSSYLDFKS